MFLVEPVGTCQVTPPNCLGAGHTMRIDDKAGVTPSSEPRLRNGFLGIFPTVF